MPPLYEVYCSQGDCGFKRTYFFSKEDAKTLGFEPECPACKEDSLRSRDAALDASIEDCENVTLGIQGPLQLAQQNLPIKMIKDAGELGLIGRLINPSSYIQRKHDLAQKELALCNRR
jgi:hypothetical protein